MRVIQKAREVVLTVRIGEVVFMRSGDPAIVRDRSKATGQLELDADPGVVRKEMRHGYINGIAPKEREELYKILDEVKGSSADPEERTLQLREKLTEIEKDPKNHMLAQYLRSEMMHIMNAHNIRPRIYSIHETKAE